MEVISSFSKFTDFDIYLFKAGKHYRIYNHLGSHITTYQEQKGVYFAVWAPNAVSVSLIGDFNNWKRKTTLLHPRWDGSGIWEGFIPNLAKGTVYKYCIETQEGFFLEKSDPYARYSETPPQNASVVWENGYTWNDATWLKERAQKRPNTVYEVHVGSWKTKKDKNNKERPLTYRELAKELVPYVANMGFSHVELMPIMEYPYDPSWGYQIVGYYAATSRFGTPQDLMYLIDAFHQAGIGVILDWVPSHFPADGHGLGFFDGTHLYEHADPRKGYHPDWKSLIFNYGRNEVRSFLISNALFWLEQYHADGLRVDAVASMLYLDYSRKEGEWLPNIYGGNENLEVISFFHELNTIIAQEFPDISTIAEESTAWAKVSRPVEFGGLGFSQKWMMGWMHDTLKYFKEQTRFRTYHHGTITFSMVYAFSENFMLPLSHDEVVHGKGSLIRKMQGDEWQRFANLRLLFGYMFTHVGTKLIFMGGEFAQVREWDFAGSLDWDLLKEKKHLQMQNWVKRLNELVKKEPALHEIPFHPDTFEWLAHDDSKNSVIIYLRKTKKAAQTLLVVCNFTENVHHDYRFGVPDGIKEWVEVLNSDADEFGGSDLKNTVVKTEAIEQHQRKQSISITLPPLSVVVFKKKTVVKKK